MNESLPQRCIGRMGNEDLAFQFWSTRSPDLKTLLIILVGVRERCSLPITYSQEFE